MNPQTARPAESDGIESIAIQPMSTPTQEVY